ncbi:Dual specificity tyrosine-phosphorylation-regulated kinase [Allomyces arbusculus]|nr:Dual specificity tyrosine-phosphorylation-regulated kinase [Allomyces arbusculus]
MPTFLSPQDVIASSGNQLTSFETYEVLTYPEVYYWGQSIFSANKKKTNGLSDALPNNGFDDSKGDYLIQPHDHIAFRYEILEVLGKGSFGQVVRALDHKTQEQVALKIIRNKKRFTSQGEIEIRILEDLKRWDPDDSCNCVQMVETFKFRNHLCIVFELLSMNLYEFIKGNDFRGSSVGLIRRFTVQILNCLCLLWRNQIIHCDLKPENVLLRATNKSQIKVIDFGSSCHLSEKAYTYIQSRFYRSPEVILGAPYEMAIDMWSLGCILVELFTGYPIFPGENEQDQLWCMMEVLGLPDPDLMAIAERKHLFFDPNNEPKPFTNSKGKSRKVGAKTLANAIKCRDEPLFVDFIAKCLIWDPNKRMKPTEAIHHPWIVQIDSAAARGLADVRHPLGSASSTSSSLGGARKSATASGKATGGKMPRALPPIVQLSAPAPSAQKPYPSPRTYQSRPVYASKISKTIPVGPAPTSAGRRGSGGLVAEQPPPPPTQAATTAGVAPGTVKGIASRWSNPQV